jgi:hypothetical protein
MALKTRVQAEEDLIHWPWESNELDIALRRLQEEGVQTVARVTDQRKALSQTAENKLTSVEDRFQILTAEIGAIDSRLVLGQQLVETDLLVKQARAFYEEGQFERSIEASEKAGQRRVTNRRVEQRVRRYADHGRIGRWQQMAKETIEWSRRHRTSAIIVRKPTECSSLQERAKVLS